jgi:NADP-reducing hydrogenase subunit HndC
MLNILNRITTGEGKESDLALLEELSEFMEMASLCALGQTASNPVRSTIRYFRDEFEAHIREKRCPAGVCTALIEYEIDPVKCTACGACAKACAVGAIEKVDSKTYTVDQEKCIKCGSCYSTCPDKWGALIKVPAVPATQPLAGSGALCEVRSQCKN